MGWGRSSIITGAGPGSLSYNLRVGSNIDDAASNAAQKTLSDNYETWLGNITDFYQLHTSRSTDYNSSIGYYGGIYGGSINREKWWSIPLFRTGDTMAAAAAGTYDSMWTTAANDVVTASYPTSGPIRVRTAWEFNGNWQPWAVASGGEATFVSAWQRFVTTFRAVTGGSRFEFVWCPNHVFGTANLDSCYPGNTYVDYLSLDFYASAGSANEAAAIATFIDQSESTQGTLRWLAAKANTVGKPWGVDEWGVQQTDYALYIQRAYEFFTKTGTYSSRTGQPASYAAFWEKNAAYPSRLQDNDQGTTVSAFKTYFGNSNHT